MDSLTNHKPETLVVPTTITTATTTKENTTTTEANTVNNSNQPGGGGGGGSAIEQVQSSSCHELDRRKGMEKVVAEVEVAGPSTSRTTEVEEDKSKVFNNSCDQSNAGSQEKTIPNGHTMDTAATNSTTPCPANSSTWSQVNNQTAKAPTTTKSAGEESSSKSEIDNNTSSTKTTINNSNLTRAPPSSSFSMDTLLQQTIVNTKVETPSVDNPTSGGPSTSQQPQSSISSTLALSPSIVISKQNTPLSSVLSDEYSIESPVSVGSSGKDEPGKPMRKRDPAEERQRLRNYRLPHHKGLSRVSATATTTTTTSTSVTSTTCPVSSKSATTGIVSSSSTSKTSAADSSSDSKVKGQPNSDNSIHNNNKIKPKPVAMPINVTPLAPLKPQPTLLQPTAVPGGHLFNSPIFLPSGPTAFSSFPQSYPFPFLPAIFNNQFFNPAAAAAAAASITPVNSKPMAGSVVSTASGVSPQCTAPTSIAPNRFFHPHPIPSSQSQLTIFTSPTGAGGPASTLSPFPFQSPATLLSPTFSPTGLPNGPGSGTPLLVPKPLNFSPNLTFPASGAALDPHSLMMFGFPNGLQPPPQPPPSGKIIASSAATSSSASSTLNAGNSHTTTTSPPFILPRLVNNVGGSANNIALPGCSIVPSSMTSNTSTACSRSGKSKDRSSTSSTTSAYTNNSTITKPLPIKPSILPPTFILSNPPPGTSGGISLPPQQQPQSILQPQTLLFLQQPTIPTIQAPSPQALSANKISISSDATTTSHNNALDKKGTSGNSSSSFTATSKSADSQKITATSTAGGAPPSLTIAPNPIRPALPNFIFAPTSPHTHSQLPYTLFSSQAPPHTLMQPISIQAPPPPPPSSMLGGPPLLLSVISPTNRNQINNLAAAAAAAAAAASANAGGVPQFGPGSSNSHSPSTVLIQSPPTINTLPVSIPLPMVSNAIKTFADSKVTSTSSKACGSKTSSKTTSTRTSTSNRSVNSVKVITPAPPPPLNAPPMIIQTTPEMMISSVALSTITTTTTTTTINNNNNTSNNSVVVVTAPASNVASSHAVVASSSSVLPPSLPAIATSAPPPKSFFSTLNESHFRDCSLLSSTYHPTPIRAPLPRPIPLSPAVYVNPVRPPGTSLERPSVSAPEPSSKLISPNPTIGIEEFQNLVRSVNDTIKSFSPSSDFYDVDLSNLKHKGEKINVVVVEDDAFSPEKMKPLLDKELTVKDATTSSSKSTSDEATTSKEDQKKAITNKKLIIKSETNEQRINVIEDIKPKRKTREDDYTSDGSRSKKKKSKKHKDKKKEKMRAPEIVPIASKAKLKKKIMPKVNCIKDPEVLEKVKDIIQIFSTTFKVSEVTPKRILPAPLPEMFRVRYVKKATPDVKMSSKACGSDRHQINMGRSREKASGSHHHRNKSESSNTAATAAATSSSQSFLPLKKRQHRNVEDGMEEDANLDGSTAQKAPPSSASLSSIDSTIESVVTALAKPPTAESGMQHDQLGKKAKKKSRKSITAPEFADNGGRNIDGTTGLAVNSAMVTSPHSLVPLPPDSQRAKAECKVEDRQSGVLPPAVVACGSGSAHSSPAVKKDKQSKSCTHTTHTGQDRFAANISLLAGPSRPSEKAPSSLVLPSPKKAESGESSAAGSSEDDKSLVYGEATTTKSAVSQRVNSLILENFPQTLSTVDSILNDVVNNYRSTSPINTDPSDADDELDGEESATETTPDRIKQESTDINNLRTNKAVTTATPQIVPPIEKKRRRRRFNRTGFDKQRKRSSSTAKAKALLHSSENTAAIRDRKKKLNTSQANGKATPKKSFSPSKTFIENCVYSSSSEDCAPVKKTKSKHYLDNQIITVYEPDSTPESDLMTMESDDPTDSGSSSESEYNEGAVFEVTKPRNGASSRNVRRPLKNPYQRPIPEKKYKNDLVTKSTTSTAICTEDSNFYENTTFSKKPNLTAVVGMAKATFGCEGSLLIKTSSRSKAKCASPPKALFEDYNSMGHNPFSENMKSANFKRIEKNIVYNGKAASSSSSVPTPDSSNNCSANQDEYIECLPTCSNPDCTNKRIQKGEWVAGLQRVLTRSRGWGIRTTEFIPKNTFIMEYLGEVITDKIFAQRMIEVYKNERHHYSLKLSNTVIDSYRFGSEARFVNHSCEPNCHMQKWVSVGGERMALFSTRDIQPMEELFYDYKFFDFNSKSFQKCLCKAANCRGTIGKAKVKNNHATRSLEDDATEEMATPAQAEANADIPEVGEFNRPEPRVIVIVFPRPKKPDLPPNHPLSFDFYHHSSKRDKMAVFVRKSDMKLTCSRRRLHNPLDSGVNVTCSRIAFKLFKALNEKDKKDIKKAQEGRFFLLRNMSRLFRVLWMAYEENKENHLNGYVSDEPKFPKRIRLNLPMSEANFNTSDSEASAAEFVVDNFRPKCRTRGTIERSASSIQFFKDSVSQFELLINRQFGWNLAESDQTTDQAKNGRAKPNRARKPFQFKQIEAYLKQNPFIQYDTFKTNFQSYITEEVNIIKANIVKFRPAFSAHIMSLVMERGNTINWNLYEKYLDEMCKAFFRSIEDSVRERKIPLIANDPHLTIYQRLDKKIDKLEQAENNNLHLSERNRKRFNQFWEKLDSTNPVDLTETTAAKRLVEHLLVKENEKKKFYNFVNKPAPTNDKMVHCSCGVPRENIGPEMIQCDSCQIWQHLQCAEQGVDINLEQYHCEKCTARNVLTEVKFLKHHPRDKINTDDPMMANIEEYVNMESPILPRKIRLGDCVYLKRADLSSLTNANIPDAKLSTDEFSRRMKIVAKGAINGFAQPFTKYDTLIMRVEKLVVLKATRQKLIYGVMFLWPWETRREPTRRFYLNELLKVGTHEWAALEEVRGFCEVLDEKTYTTGRPYDIKPEDLYVVTHSYIEPATKFRALKAGFFPVCKEDYVFGTYKQKIKIERNFKPASDQKGPLPEEPDNSTPQEKAKRQKTLNLLKITNGLSKLAYHRHLLEQQLEGVDNDESEDDED